MGGNKSKPVAETARTVLMRRSREEVHKVADTGVAASAPSSSAEVSQPQHVPRANTEMDPAILKEMSKWSFVRSSDKPPKQVVTKGEPSAAIIRMKEIKEREGLSPAELKIKNIGRLSEEELQKLMSSLRTDSSSNNLLKLAKENRISQLNVEQLHKYIRTAKVTPPGEGESFPVAS